MTEGVDPRKARELQKARIDAAMEVLSEILSKGISSRDEVRRLLEESYRRRAIQPIRGKAWPPDIWDKEMATLYVIAKYALMLNEENPELFGKIFSFEETLEEAVEAVLTREPEDARRYVLFLLGGSLDDNMVARLLRVETTKVILGFGDESRVIELLQRLVKVFPEQERTVRKYARYFIALLVAQAIAAGLVRNRIAKEALKQALAARIGLGKIIPDDSYIEFIASTVFMTPKKRLARIFSHAEQRGENGRGRSRRQVARKSRGVVEEGSAAGS